MITLTWTRHLVPLALLALTAAACGDDPAETTSAPSDEQAQGADDANGDDGPPDLEDAGETEQLDSPPSGDDETGEGDERETASAGPATRDALAELEGPNDGTVVAVVDQFARRGEVVELSFRVENRGEDDGWGYGFGYSNSNFLSGGLDPDDPAHGSIQGVTLIDGANNARHRPLRDGDGNCACYAGRIQARPGESMGLFASFPAPPEDVTDMTIQIPQFGSIELGLS